MFSSHRILDEGLMPETTDRYTATRLSAELGLDNRKMWDILTRVNPVQVKGRSKLYLLRDIIPHAAKYLAHRSASSYTPSGGLASTVSGIFGNEFFEVDPLSGVGVVCAQPGFICAKAACPPVQRQAMRSRSTALPIQFALFSPKVRASPLRSWRRISRWL